VEFGFRKRIFRISKGNQLTFSNPDALCGFLLKELCKMYSDKGWVQQFHVGATRNNNSLMLKNIGANTGFDAIGEQYFAQRMSVLFDELNSEGKLAKTIIYNLNPVYNEVLASLAGNFNESGIKSKIQFGAAWWFLDQLGWDAEADEHAFQYRTYQHICRNADRFQKFFHSRDTNISDDCFVICSETRWKKVLFPMTKNGLEKSFRISVIIMRKTISIFKNGSGNFK
jgi:glucuronate isomerase